MSQFWKGFGNFELLPSLTDTLQGFVGLLGVGLREVVGQVGFVGVVLREVVKQVTGKLARVGTGSNVLGGSSVGSVFLELAPAFSCNGGGFVKDTVLDGG